jgi:mannosyltransferase
MRELGAPERVPGQVRIMKVKEMPPASAARAAPAEQRSAGRVPDGVLVALLTLLLAVLVLADVGRKSFWLDESFTWSSVARPWGAFVTHVRTQEAGGALFHLLMWVWARISDTEGFLRFPAAVFAIALAPATYLLARRLFDSRVALIATLLVAVNANVVAFGQEARAYSCAMLLTVVSAHGFARDVERPSRGAWLEWVLASAALVWVQVLGSGVVLAELVALFVLVPTRDQWRRVGAGLVGIAVLSAPMGLMILTQSSTLDGNPHRFHTPLAVMQAIISLAGMGGPLLVLSYAGLLAIAGAAAWQAWERSRRNPTPGRPTEAWRYGLAVSLLVVPTVFTLVAALVQRVFWARYLLPSLPALAILGAVALSRLRGRVLVAGLAVMVVLSGWGLARWYLFMPKDDWRDATAYVFDHARRGDAVVFAGDEGRIPFEYYLSRRPGEEKTLVPAFPARSWTEFRTGDQRRVLPTVAQLRSIAERYDRVWVFEVYAGPDDDRDEARDRFRAGLAPTMRRVSDREFDIDLHTYLYERR